MLINSAFNFVFMYQLSYLKHGSSWLPKLTKTPLNTNYNYIPFLENNWHKFSNLIIMFIILNSKFTD